MELGASECGVSQCRLYLISVKLKLMRWFECLVVCRADYQRKDWELNWDTALVYLETSGILELFSCIHQISAHNMFSVLLAKY